MLVPVPVKSLPEEANQEVRRLPIRLPTLTSHLLMAFNLWWRIWLLSRNISNRWKTKREQLLLPGMKAGCFNFLLSSWFIFFLLAIRRRNRSMLEEEGDQSQSDNDDGDPSPPAKRIQTQNTIDIDDNEANIANDL